MKGLKISLGLWIVGGSCFLISGILNFMADKSYLLVGFGFFVAFLFFTNAYLTYDKITKGGKLK